ncbi:MAG: Aminoglycoside phosphotransferase [Jatrophihabitantaceae bacterium]|nr:Aminoglycoside phosphotransferase [Jatrophihabitantaceae bacterium]
MSGQYVGYVDGQDPMHSFLARVFRDQIGMRGAHPAFRAFRMTGSNDVYEYEEKSSGTRVVCKFFGPRFGWDRDQAAWWAGHEYDGLETLRRYGLIGSPHHVVRPLGLDPELGCVLAVEHYGGESLSQAIDACLHEGDSARLFWRLKALAYFLATQHNRTAVASGADFGADREYLGIVTQRLQDAGRMGDWDAGELRWLGDRWAERPQMWRDAEVLLHGDATPANFLFGGGMNVGAIDLERMKRGDRMFDVGRIAGELQHAFMAATGDWRCAEPFIGHFLWEYSCHFPDRDSAFRSMSARMPFYMAMNLLRVARNGYLDDAYAGRLVEQSKQLLRAG